METRTSAETEVHEVLRWRREQLVEAGFSLPLAAQIASARGYDLHALLELVGRGCAPELAARILAPVDQEPHAA